MTKKETSQKNPQDAHLKRIAIQEATNKVGEVTVRITVEAAVLIILAYMHLLAFIQWDVVTSKESFPGILIFAVPVLVGDFVEGARLVNFSFRTLQMMALQVEKNVTKRNANSHKAVEAEEGASDKIPENELIIWASKLTLD